MFKWALIKQHLVKPLVTQVGTKLALVFTGWGIGSAEVDQIILGATAAILVAFDVAVAFFSKKS